MWRKKGCSPDVGHVNREWWAKGPIAWLLHKRHHGGTVATQELCGVHGHYDDGLSLPLRTWLSGMYVEMCSVDICFGMDFNQHAREKENCVGCEHERKQLYCTLFWRLWRHFNTTYTYTFQSDLYFRLL